MSHPNLTPQKILLTCAICFLCGYGLFNSRFLLKGPEVAVAGLDPSGEVIRTTSRDFSLQGTALHSSFITVNNRPILVDESGNFNEKLLLSSGVSIIDIYARDKFGKEVRKKIDVVYTGEPLVVAAHYQDLVEQAQKTSSTTTEVENTSQEDPSQETSPTATSTQSTATGTE
jgi:hypothetical protein